MENKALFDKIFSFGQDKGFQDMELSYTNSIDSTIRIFKKEIDTFNLSETEELKFTGIYNGKMGKSYTEKVDESSIDLLVNDAFENTQIINSNDEVEIFEGSEEYKKVNTYNKSLDSISEDDKISLAKNIEKAIYELDNRVFNAQITITSSKQEKILTNTKGLNLHSIDNLICVITQLIAKENNDVKSSFTFTVDNDFTSLDPITIAKNAVKKATQMLGATKEKSGTYTCVIENDTMASLLAAFAEIFTADKIQKNLSLLKDKLNQKIASDKLTIIDNPFLEKGFASASFDEEGAACTYKVLIENGVLKNYLYDLKTAKIDGVKTTGNASTNSTIAPSNMYVKTGDKSLDEIISTIDDGLLINSLSGLHAGLNKISGDFSLLAAGLLIKDGKIIKPVEQFTVAGNFFDMIKDIDCIGNDLKFGPPRASYIGSPSIKFNSLAISGE